MQAKGINPLDENNKNMVEPKVLLEAMELREEIETIRGSARTAMTLKLKDDLRRCSEEFSKALNGIESSSENKRAAIQLTARMRYLEKALEELDEKDDER